MVLQKTSFNTCYTTSCRHFFKWLLKFYLWLNLIVSTRQFIAILHMYFNVIVIILHVFANSIDFFFFKNSDTYTYTVQRWVDNYKNASQHLIITKKIKLIRWRNVPYDVKNPLNIKADVAFEKQGTCYFRRYIDMELRLKILWFLRRYLYNSFTSSFDFN